MRVECVRACKRAGRRRHNAPCRGGERTEAQYARTARQTASSGVEYAYGQELEPRLTQPCTHARTHNRQQASYAATGRLSHDDQDPTGHQLARPRRVRCRACLSAVACWRLGKTGLQRGRRRGRFAVLARLLHVVELLRRAAARSAAAAERPSRQAASFPKRGLHW